MPKSHSKAVILVIPRYPRGHGIPTGSRYYKVVQSCPIRWDKVSPIGRVKVSPPIMRVKISITMWVKVPPGQGIPLSCGLRYPNPVGQGVLYRARQDIPHRVSQCIPHHMGQGTPNRVDQGISQYVGHGISHRRIMVSLIM